MLCALHPAVMLQMANQLVLVVCTLICRHLKINLQLLLLEPCKRDCGYTAINNSLQLCTSQLLSRLIRNIINVFIYILPPYCFTMCFSMFFFRIFAFRKLYFAIREGGKKNKKDERISSWRSCLVRVLSVPIRKADSGNGIMLPREQLDQFPVSIC